MCFSLVCLVFGHHKQEITVVKGFGKKTCASLNPRKRLHWTREKGDRTLEHHPRAWGKVRWALYDTHVKKGNLTTVHES